MWEIFRYLFAAARPGVGEDAVERVIGVSMVAHVVDDFEDARRVPADRQRLLVKVEGDLEGVGGDDGAVGGRRMAAIATFSNSDGVSPALAVAEGEARSTGAEAESAEAMEKPAAAASAASAAAASVAAAAAAAAEVTAPKLPDSFSWEKTSPEGRTAQESLDKSK